MAISRGWLVGATAFVLALPLLMLGGVHQQTLLVAAWSTALVGALMATRSSDVDPTLGSRAASVYFAGVVVACALQLVPLPPGLLQRISPSSSLHQRAVDTLLGADRWHTISLDVPATEFALVTALGVAVCYMLASRLAARPHGQRLLALAIAIAILAFVGVTLAHSLVGATHLYGFYEPKQPFAPIPLLPPLVNPNQAAAVASVGPPLLLGLAMDAPTPRDRTIAIVLAVVTGAVALLCLSRGAMVVLALECLVMGLFAWRSRVVSGGRLRGGLAALGAAAGALAIAIAIAPRALWVQATDLDTSKLTIGRHAMGLIRDFRWAGVGAGAFGAVFPAYEGSLGGLHRFAWAESWPVQLLSDFGWVAGGLLIALLLTATFASARTAARRPVAMGALVALGGLLLHDLGDFAMQFVGVGQLAAALLAVVVRGEGTPTRRDGRRWSGWILSAALLVGAPTVLHRHWGHLAEDDADALAARWQSGRLPPARPDIDRALQLHPVEPYFALVAGVARGDTPSAGPWFLHAVRLGPWRSQTHFWLARWFARTGHRSSAWPEFRAAVDCSAELGPVVAREMVALGAPLVELEFTPRDQVTFEATSIALSEARREGDAGSIDQTLIDRYPPAIPARLRQIERARAKGDLAVARTLASALVSAAPKSPEGYIESSRLAADDVGALRAVEQGLAMVGEEPDLLAQLIRVTGHSKDLDELLPELNRLRAALMSRQASLELLHLVQAQVELQRDHIAAAIRHYLDAAAVATPATGPQYLETAAVNAGRLGRKDLALTTWRTLLERYPNHPSARLAEEHLRSPP